MKIFLRRMHLITALFSAFFLLTLSLSGALLLYAKDIQQLIFPEHWSVPNTSEAVNAEQLIAQIEHEFNSKVALITLPQDENTPWQVRLQNGDYLNVDATQQSVIHQYDYYQTFYGFMMALHRWLAIDNDNKPLQVFMSITSLLLIVQLILGLYLWLKPKKPLKRLKVHWRAKAKIKYAQLHNMIGVIVILPLLLISLSGMAFHWKDEVKTLLNVIFWDEITVKEKPKVAPFIGKVQLNQALKNASKVYPNGKLYRIYLPVKPTDPIGLRYTLPAEAHANSWIWLAPSTGSIIDAYDATKTNAVTQVWNFRYPFHVGEFIGWPVKLLWLFISLTPVFFVITGFYLYFARRPAKPLASRAMAANKIN